MTTGFSASIGGQNNDPVRLAQRLARLRQSIERAEGERKESLQGEIDAIRARLAEIIAALDSVEA